MFSLCQVSTIVVVTFFSKFSLDTVVIHFLPGNLKTLKNGFFSCHTKSNIKLSTEGVKQEMCFGSNNEGLTYPPINAITIIKGLHNHLNWDASDKHPFKEDMKTKFAAAKAQETFQMEKRLWNL